VYSLARKVTHARKQNPWADCDELLHRCSGPWRNHLCQFFDSRIRGLSVVGGGQILGSSIDLRRRPYNTLWLSGKHFALRVDIRDVVKCTKFGDDWLKG